MDFLQAITLGVVEGITEFLPISSTGHMILASKIMHLSSTEFLKSFEIMIQLGAILAVVVLYWRSLLVNQKIIKRIAAAFIPTAIVGFVLYKLVKKVLLGNAHVVVWSLFLGGIFIILFERFHKESPQAESNLEKIPYRTACLIGLCQAIAIIPGVSRSAATILGGLALGIKRKTIVEFSFFLAVPTMLAATALDFLKSATDFHSTDFGLLLVGFGTSFIIAILSIKLFLRFIQTNSLIVFGVYRIFVAIIFLFWK